MMYGSAQTAPSQTQAVTSPTAAASATMPVHAPIVRSRRAEPASLAIVYLLGIAAIVYATR